MARWTARPGGRSASRGPSPRAGRAGALKPSRGRPPPLVAQRRARTARARRAAASDCAGETTAHKLRSAQQLRGFARSSGAWAYQGFHRAFGAQHRQFFFTADGARVPLQARRSRARRLRLRVAAGAARTCVARLQPPRPLIRWPSPRRRGPRSPCDDLCGPAECPTSPALSMPTTTFCAKTTPSPHPLALRPGSLDARRAARSQHT